MDHFLNEEKLCSFLRVEPEEEKVKAILKKAKILKGLTLNEVAILLNLKKGFLLEELFQTAKEIKKAIYGDRLVLFAPLYISNYCSNNCRYCGFRKANSKMLRRKLSLEEVQREVQCILEEGHKRILMLMGESSLCSLDYFFQAIEAAYQVMDSKSSRLRRINLEIAPLSEEEFQRLSHMKIGTYTVFQETYHQETYRKMHPSGKKADYFWRLLTMDRALKNGLHDVGIGALFGLYDYRFEVLALLEHANHLEERFGVGPHTVSVPRIEPALAPAAQKVPYPVDDLDFKKIIAVLRCSLPYTGIILSTREKAAFRDELFHLGVSQISAGSRTNPGGYTEKVLTPDKGQFSVNDIRAVGEVIRSVIERGFVPSFCTGCYRRGRVGKDFMELAKPGLIQQHCLPNALLTLQEYLLDYADNKTKESGQKLIEKKLEEIPFEHIRKRTKDYLQRLQQGERDLYF